MIETDGHIHRFLLSPDGRRIAVEWAADADENAILGLVDAATGALRLHDDIRLRHDTMLWSPDSQRLDVVASRDGALVSVDVATGELTSLSAEPGERLRLFPGGRDGLLARGTPGAGTTLTDRATGALLGRWSALFRAAPLPSGVLVWHGGGIDAVDPTGSAIWHWDDPLVSVVDVAVHGERITVLGLTEGRSMLIDLCEGVEENREEAGSAGLTTTMIGVDDGVLRLGMEGPLDPPRIVDRSRAALASSSTTGVTVRHDIRADDGALLTAHVTTPPHATGPQPLILTCYGGFGVPHLPVFEPTVPAWIELGGAFASAQLRGGGENGRAWRDAGRGAGKERTIADLAAIARGLVERGVTRPGLLVLAGASLGGVVAAACALRHPDVCAGVVTTAAPLDLLALEEHPLGSLWRGEFGDDGTHEARTRLRELSPLAHAESLPEGAAAPAYLGIVLDRDTRVLARDTERMVDALRRAGASATLWTAPGAGHGGNDLRALHDLGLSVLDFAAELTMGAAS